MGLLSEEEMNVSITTCAPLKKSPNYAKGEKVRDRDRPTMINPLHLRLPDG